MEARTMPAGGSSLRSSAISPSVVASRRRTKSCLGSAPHSGLQQLDSTSSALVLAGAHTGFSQVTAHSSFVQLSMRRSTVAALSDADPTDVRTRYLVAACGLAALWPRIQSSTATL